MWSQVFFFFHRFIFLPAVAGAEAGSSPEAEVGNLHLLVHHHTGAVPLLLGIQAVVLAEEAGALQDPWLSSGSRLLQPPSPGKQNNPSPDSKTRLQS